MATGILFAITGLAIWIKWGKLVSLLWQDPAWWLNEYARYARGELPYRDFFWPYGPLSADIYGWSLRIFGRSFTVVQTVTDILSAMVVLFFYKVTRRIMPRPLPELTTICLIAIGITARTYFSLFSMIGYTQSIHVGAIGLLLMMWAVLTYLDEGKRRSAVFIVGAWVACLGKQEPLMAAVLVFVLLALFDLQFTAANAAIRTWTRTYSTLGVSCFLPPLLIYVWWAQVAGWGKFLACIQGFGLATLACPWWPNGYGLVGAAIALSKAALVIIVGAFLVPYWRARLSGRHLMLILLALCCIASIVAFEWPYYSDILRGRGTFRERLERDAVDLLSTSSVLRPVLWAGLIYCAALVYRLARWRRLSASQFGDLVIVAVPAIMAVRSLFGSILTHNLEVPAITYPFLLLCGPYLLYSILRTRGSAAKERSLDRPAISFCAAILALYAIVRVAGGYGPLLSNHSFPKVDTPAGSLGLKESSIEKPVLDYVLANSAATDTILELPFGGGVSFAADRPQPTYSTLFIQLRPSESIQNEDLARLKAHPPAIVIALNSPHLGTLYGVEGDVGCVFPSLTWKSGKPSSNPSYTFPFVDYLEHNYRVDRTIGPWLLLRPIGHAAGG